MKKSENNGKGGFAFLFKPLFFIFSLLLGSWLVLKIEKLIPSDFGKYKSLFEKEDSLPGSTRQVNRTEEGKVREKDTSSGIRESQKAELKKLIFEYKNGVVDSILFEMKLDEFFKSPP